MPQLCRLTEKETELKEQGSVKLQEWNKALTPLQEWFVKSEQKLESLENLESNMNNLKRQNQEYLVCLFILKTLKSFASTTKIWQSNLSTCINNMSFTLM